MTAGEGDVVLPALAVGTFGERRILRHGITALCAVQVDGVVAGEGLARIGVCRGRFVRHGIVKFIGLHAVSDEKVAAIVEAEGLRFVADGVFEGGNGEILCAVLRLRLHESAVFGVGVEIGVEVGHELAVGDVGREVGDDAGFIHVGDAAAHRGIDDVFPIAAHVLLVEFGAGVFGGGRLEEVKGDVLHFAVRAFELHVLHDVFDDGVILVIGIVAVLPCREVPGEGGVCSRFAIAAAACKNGCGRECEHARKRESDEFAAFHIFSSLKFDAFEISP